MKRILTVFALALSVAGSSAVALAAPAKEHAARHEKGDMAKKFPMKAEEFQQHASKRAQKARERMEKHIAEKKLPEDKANEIRAKFNAAQVKVGQKVTEVCADGTVTLDEAKAVHAVAREAMPHKKHAKKGKKLARIFTSEGPGPPLAHQAFRCACRRLFGSPVGCCLVRLSA